MLIINIRNLASVAAVLLLELVAAYTFFPQSILLLYTKNNKLLNEILFIYQRYPFHHSHFHEAMQIIKNMIKAYLM